MTQFFKTYKKLYKNGCKPNQVAILTAIFDRMESSRKRTNFYSDTHNDYFVIYTYEELASELNLSKNTVANIIKKCVEQGYLMIELMHSRINKIFMTAKSKELAGIEDLDNNQGTKNCDLGTKNCDLIRLNKQTNTDITNITAKTNKPKKEIHNQQQINALMNTLLNHVKLPKRTVSYLKELAFNDPELMYHYAGLLLKAKHCVKVAANKFSNNNPNWFVFEDNEVLSEWLNNNVYGILIKANKYGHNRDRYIMGAFINMFKEYFNEVVSGGCEYEYSKAAV